MTLLRVATYNIHKGVQGIGPTRRLEIHNLGHAVEQFDADIICLQEVRKLHRREERHFNRWPTVSQAEFLAPEGYGYVYRTNAITRYGEHGNALLSRWPIVAHQHEDMSDHRFEQRGLLHAEVQFGGALVHVLVVHLGLIRASRVRQLKQLLRFIVRELPANAALVVAGDFNDTEPFVRKALSEGGLISFAHRSVPTFPSRLPLVQLDHVFVRGMRAVSLQAPRGTIWGRMSDHLPLIAEFDLSGESQ
jgi:endonuclease/exonuclease/phosphatase family metal-dependent hydrolase